MLKVLCGTIDANKELLLLGVWKIPIRLIKNEGIFQIIEQISITWFQGELFNDE